MTDVNLFPEYEKQPEEDELNTTPATQGFIVDSLDKAEWTIRKLAGLQGLADSIEEHAVEEMQRVKSWRDSEMAKVKEDIAFFETHLRAFTEKNLPEDKKSISLINGTLQLKQKPITFIHDDEALLTMAKTLGMKEYIKVEESFAWGEYKKRLIVTDTGDVIDSATGEVTLIKTEPITTTFSVKFKGGK